MASLSTLVFISRPHAFKFLGATFAISDWHDSCAARVSDWACKS